MAEWISTPGSSNIAGFHYDDLRETLTVEFNNGTKYEYYDIPLHVGNGMIKADSYGKYLNSEIKEKYRFARL